MGHTHTDSQVFYLLIGPKDIIYCLSDNMAASEEAYSYEFIHSEAATTNVDMADIVTYEIAGSTVVTTGLLMAIPVAYLDGLNLP